MPDLTLTDLCGCGNCESRMVGVLWSLREEFGVRLSTTLVSQEVTQQKVMDSSSRYTAVACVTLRQIAAIIFDKQVAQVRTMDDLN